MTMPFKKNIYLHCKFSNTDGSICLAVTLSASDLIFVVHKCKACYEDIVYGISNQIPTVFLIFKNLA